MKKIVLMLLATLCLGTASFAQAVTHSVILNWTPSSATCVVSTNIHRATTPGGEIPIGTTGSNFATVPATTSSYTDLTVVAGQTYYWTVSAWGSTCGGTLHESVMSNEVKTLVPADVVIPPAPTGLTAIVQ